MAGEQDQTMAGTGEGLKIRIGRAELPKLSYHLLAHILLSTVMQRDKLNPNKAKSKEKKYLLLI